MRLPLFNSLAIALLCSHGSGQELQLLAPDAAPHDLFGYSVAISGNTAIVGAHGDDDNGFWSGSAYLFDTTTGTMTAKLLPHNGGDSYDKFGRSVAISGTTAIVGAYENWNVSLSNWSGSAYLFDTVTGTQVAKLNPSDGEHGDYFGYAVAISGTTAIIGAYYDDDNGGNSGSAYLFDTTTGTQLFKLTPSDGASNDRFGFSVGISGTTAIVGAYYDDDSGSNSGSAYLFDTTTGSQLAKLLPGDGAVDDLFGFSVAISGTTAIVGACFDDDSGSNSGSAYLFNATSGAPLFKLTPSDSAAGDCFGRSVAISGVTTVVGAYNDDDNGSDSGSAYLFDATTGAQLTKLIPSDGAGGDYFGYSVATRDSLAIVGAWGDGDPISGGGSGNNSGSAYLLQVQSDCNENGIPDDEDISSGLSSDCDGNLLPDECEYVDCDLDGVSDNCEIASGSEADLNGNGIPDSCECLATSYCPPSPNTAGPGVQISITGTPSVGLNNLGFDATGGPANQPGLFFHGPGALNQPFGEGIRCVTTPILRVGPPVFFNGAGNASKQLDMNANALSGIQPSDTRYFQLWYRDPLGGFFGYNLSNGLEIRFCL